MTGFMLRSPADPVSRARRRRQRFGLEAPLPADRRVVERAILRHLREDRPHVVAFPLTAGPGAPKPLGEPRAAIDVPDLLLLAPGGRVAFLTIKPQAEDLSRAHRAFADLCRSCGVALLVVRSLDEARAAFDRHAL